MRVLFVGDRPQDRDDGRQAALRTGLECAATDCVPFADLRLRLSREPQAHLIVVYLGADPVATSPLIRAAVEHVSQPVFAVGNVPDPTAAASLGVTGVWHPDGLREGLLTATNHLRKAARVPDSRGRVLVVASAQPGVGVTTVASGLAFALANPETVSLVELVTGTPELALDLDLTPRYSVAELVRASARVDVSMIRGAAVAHKSGVSVLAYAQDTITPEVVTPAVARDFQILLRTAFAWSVVDAGYGTGPGVMALLTHADAVVVVTRLDPPGLRLTRRFVVALAEGGVPVEDLVIVANRYGQSGQVPWKKAEDSLRTKVRAWLPDDPGSVNAALRDARPLAEVARRSRLARGLRTLAGELQTALAPADR